MADKNVPPDTNQDEIEALRRRVAALEEELQARDRNEAARRAQEERYRALVTSAAQIFWVANPKGEIEIDSPSWRRFTGQTWEEFQGFGWLAPLHPEDRPATEADWAKAASTGELYRTHYRLRRHDGVYRYFDVQGAPVRGPDGAIREWAGTCTDITERKEAVRALRLSEERFRQLSIRLPVGVYQTDQQGEPTFVNDRWCELVDLPRDQVSFSAWMERLHPEDRPRVQAEVAAAVREGSVLETEYRVVLRSGRVRWIQAVAAPLRCSDGDVEGFLGALTDGSQRKQLEEVLRETVIQKDIIEAQRARLVELSTPLIPIAEGIMVMPLVGDVDRERADRVVEALLAGISAAGARVAILDLTGVLEADADVAEGLLRAAQGVRLLGAEAVLSGVRPELARTLVEMGADLGGMATFGDLKAAVAHGMRAVRGISGPAGPRGAQPPPAASRR